MSDTERVDLDRNSVWRHKRLPKMARVNLVMGDDVQVIDDAKKMIRWLSIKGFLRDYKRTAEEPR